MASLWIHGSENDLTPELRAKRQIHEGSLLEILTDPEALQADEIPSDAAPSIEGDAGGLSIDLQPEGQTVTDAAGWTLPEWPPGYRSPDHRGRDTDLQRLRTGASDPRATRTAGRTLLAMWVMKHGNRGIPDEAGPEDSSEQPNSPCNDS